MPPSIKLTGSLRIVSLTFLLIDICLIPKQCSMCNRHSMVICGWRGGREEGREWRREEGGKGREGTLFHIEPVTSSIFNDLRNERLKGCMN